MAFGTLAFDTLQTSDSKNTGTSKTLDTSYVYNGSAKAWGHLNMSTGSFADSFNNSSATDFQTGSFHHNFTNAFSNSSYSISGSHNLPSGNTASILVGYDDSARFTTSSVNVAAFNVTNGRVDATRVCTKVMGDLA